MTHNATTWVVTSPSTTIRRRFCHSRAASFLPANKVDDPPRARAGTAGEREQVLDATSFPPRETALRHEPT